MYLPPFQIDMLSFSESLSVHVLSFTYPESKVPGANMGPTWVLSFPGGPHDGPINLAIRVALTWPLHHCGLGHWNLVIVHIYALMYPNSKIYWNLGKEFQWNLNQKANFIFKKNILKMSSAKSSTSIRLKGVNVYISHAHPFSSVYPMVFDSRMFISFYKGQRNIGQ